MALIGFTGGMGSGKSTAIEFLKTLTKVENVKFAQPLYDIQEYAYQRISKVHTRPSNFVKDRKLLQWVGTEWGRNSISENLWLNLWKNEVNYIQENYPEVVVTCDDVRFDNEAQAIKEADGIVIHLTSYRALDRINSNNGMQAHASEKGVDGRYIDYHLRNDGTIEEFKSVLSKVLRDILSKTAK